MAIREILQFPAEILTRPARRVGRKDLLKVRSLIKDMKETLEDAQGVGLAAPQVGESLRVAIALNVETEQVEVYLNPTVVRAEGEELAEEGCLSFKGLVGLVPRATKVTIKYEDENLRQKRVTLQGLSARIIQHEIDHLNGVTIRETSVVDLYEPKPVEGREIERASHREK